MIADLFSPAALGFVRVAVVTPELRVADVWFNTEKIIAALQAAAAARGATGGVPGVVHHGLLVRRPVLPTAAVGRGPNGSDGNCACHRTGRRRRRRRAAARGGRQAVQLRGAAADGQVLGIVPKTYLPTTNEFYEERWFTPGNSLPRDRIRIGDEEAPCGTDLLFAAENLPGW